MIAISEPMSLQHATGMKKRCNACPEGFVQPASGETSSFDQDSCFFLTIRSETTFVRAEAARSEGEPERRAASASTKV